MGIVAVIGSRSFKDSARMAEVLETRRWGTTGWISGGAKGADSLAREWCEENNENFNEYPADWTRHGKAAGHKRNRFMAEMCHECIAFWDGESPGTRNMIQTCLQLGKPVTIIPYG